MLIVTCSLSSPAILIPACASSSPVFLMMYSAYDPTIPLLGTYPNKSIIQKDTHTPNVHSSTVYNSQAMETTWRQPKCPSTDGWIKKMQYVYAMKRYSTMKKNEIMPFTAPWMDLEIIILSETRNLNICVKSKI